MNLETISESLLYKGANYFYSVQVIPNLFFKIRISTGQIWVKISIIFYLFHVTIPKLSIGKLKRGYRIKRLISKVQAKQTTLKDLKPNDYMLNKGNVKYTKRYNSRSD